MKMLMMTLMLALPLSSLVVAQKRSDREQVGLHGAVYTVQTEFTIVRKNKGQSVDVLRTIIDTYDPQGNILETVFYDNSLLESRYIFEREFKGNKLARLSIYIYEDNHVLYGKVSRLYNDLGIETQYESIQYGSGNLILTRSVISLDSSGGMVDEATYDGNGTLIKEPEISIKVKERGEAPLFGLNILQDKTLEEDSHGSWLKKKAYSIWRDDLSNNHVLPIMRGITTHSTGAESAWMSASTCRTMQVSPARLIRALCAYC